MNLVGTGYRVAFIAAALLASSSVAAFSATDILKQLRSGTCIETMSCISAVTNISVATNEPKISSKPESGDPLFSSCVEGPIYRQADGGVESCERYLKAGTGTVRERAAAMFTLGHFYYKSVNSYVEGQDPSDSKAVKTWQQAAELDPTFIEPYIAIGNMLGYSGLGEQAQMAFDRAGKIDPLDWRIYTGRANAFYHSQKLPEALKAAEKAFDIAPEEPTVRLVLGRMLTSNMKFEEAAKQFELAAINYVEHHDPMELVGEPHPLESLADAQNRMGRPALAAETISKYIETLEPMAQFFMLYQTRAEYYESAEMFEKSAADLKEAAKRAPPGYSEELMARHAIMLARTGSKNRAGEELRNVLTRGNLKSILKVQVFLRNQGYDEVVINGSYDDATSNALDSCMQDDQCAPGVGQAI